MGSRDTLAAMTSSEPDKPHPAMPTSRPPSTLKVRKTPLGEISASRPQTTSPASSRPSSSTSAKSTRHKDVPPISPLFTTFPISQIIQPTPVRSHLDRSEAAPLLDIADTNPAGTSSNHCGTLDRGRRSCSEAEGTGPHIDTLHPGPRDASLSLPKDATPRNVTSDSSRREPSNQIVTVQQAIPSTTNLNVKSAPPPVLRSLSSPERGSSRKEKPELDGHALKDMDTHGPSGIPTEVPESSSIECENRSTVDMPELVGLAESHHNVNSTSAIPITTTASLAVKPETERVNRDAKDDPKHLESVRIDTERTSIISSPTAIMLSDETTEIYDPSAPETIEIETIGTGRTLGHSPTFPPSPSRADQPFQRDYLAKTNAYASAQASSSRSKERSISDGKDVGDTARRVGLAFGGLLSYPRTCPRQEPDRETRPLENGPSLTAATISTGVRSRHPIENGHSVEISGHRGDAEGEGDRMGMKGNRIPIPSEGRQERREHQPVPSDPPKEFVNDRAKARESGHRTDRESLDETPARHSSDESSAASPSSSAKSRTLDDGASHPPTPVASPGGRACYSLSRGARRVWNSLHGLEVQMQISLTHAPRHVNPDYLEAVARWRIRVELGEADNGRLFMSEKDGEVFSEVVEALKLTLPSLVIRGKELQCESQDHEIESRGTSESSYGSARDIGAALRTETYPDDPKRESVGDVYIDSALWNVNEEHRAKAEPVDFGSFVQMSEPARSLFWLRGTLQIATQASSINVKSLMQEFRSCLEHESIPPVEEEDFIRNIVKALPSAHIVCARHISQGGASELRAFGIRHIPTRQIKINQVWQSHGRSSGVHENTSEESLEWNKRPPPGASWAWLPLLDNELSQDDSWTAHAPQDRVSRTSFHQGLETLWRKLTAQRRLQKYLTIDIVAVIAAALKVKPRTIAPAYYEITPEDMTRWTRRTFADRADIGLSSFGKSIATVDQLYGILVLAHESVMHSPALSTWYETQKGWSFVPFEAVQMYIGLCPVCKARPEAGLEARMMITQDTDSFALDSDKLPVAPKKVKENTPRILTVMGNILLATPDLKLDALATEVAKLRGGKAAVATASKQRKAVRNVLKAEPQLFTETSGKWSVSEVGRQRWNGVKFAPAPDAGAEAESGEDD